MLNKSLSKFNEDFEIDYNFVNTNPKPAESRFSAF